VKENGQFGIKPNPQYIQPPVLPAPVNSPVNQEELLHLNTIEQPALSSDVDKGKGLNIDLNELPPNEDKEV